MEVYVRGTVYRVYQLSDAASHNRLMIMQRACLWLA